MTIDQLKALDKIAASKRRSVLVKWQHTDCGLAAIRGQLQPREPGSFVWYVHGVSSGCGISALDKIEILERNKIVVTLPGKRITPRARAAAYDVAHHIFQEATL